MSFSCEIVEKSIAQIPEVPICLRFLTIDTSLFCPSRPAGREGWKEWEDQEDGYVKRLISHHPLAPSRYRLVAQSPGKQIMGRESGRDQERKPCLFYIICSICWSPR